jgi:hypothetical protein
MRKRTDVYRVLVEKFEGKNHLEEPGVNGRIMLRWIFRKFDLAQKRDRWRTLVKFGEFFDYLRAG